MTRPISSYRLQLSPDFTLSHALEALPHLDMLGVGHLYLSPILQARPGSAHGYDVADPSRVSEELGGERALRELARAAQARGMGLIADIVPNHMAADESNPWWWDVLRLGRESPHAVAFDIDWEAPGAEEKVILPVLGEPVEQAIRSGALRPADDGAELVYHDRRFPLAPGSQGTDPPTLLAHQHYQLCFWREGLERLNYRRFFDVSDLVALRADDPEVFRRSHELLLRLVTDGVLEGLRVDHVDGLADPGAYLRRLREAAGDAYIVVEKILAPGERIPDAWPVEGTTGYEFLALAGGMFIEPAGAAAIAERYVAATGRPADPEQTATAGKREMLGALFRADLDRVLRRAKDAGIAGDSSRTAVEALTVHLGVYRTYADAAGLPPGDRERLDRAAASASQEPGTQPALELVHAALAAPTAETLPFVRAWQQLTGPVAAKGVEDTALYRDTRLLARNEPGLDPSFMSSTAEQLHAWALAARSGHPMTTTSTHDTKRGEDVRSRIAALTLDPEAWLAFWGRWRDPSLGGADASADWLLLQTLAGSWPAGDDARRDYTGRIEAYMVKALREAKEGTSWLDPDEEYERRFTDRARRLLGDEQFRRALDGLTTGLAAAGAAISLGQIAAKLIAPGCPDIYWGNEVTQLTLVDPDNRRPVDFAGHGALLEQLLERHASDPQGTVAEAAATLPDGRLKLLVTHLGLTLRRRRRDLFTDGDYVPLDAGTAAYAAARRHGGEWVAAVTALRPGRALSGRLGRVDGMPAHWRDVLTGRVLDLGSASIGEVLSAAPAALLEPAGRPDAVLGNS
ncbi:MAG TPA: malto-oligosyltrehalose synthase [Gaiellales bacterium]|nr:malto-oligosyltrehalose synthase [Gaiellales bacterium]